MIDLHAAAKAVNGADLAEAITQAEAGDVDAVWRIVDPLVAIAGGASRDMVLAAVLFRLAADAGKGEPTQQMYLRAMTRLCTREAIDNASLANTLSAALLQGWLAVDHYDELAARVEKLGADNQARHLFAMVERREDPPVAHHVAVADQAESDLLWRCCLAPSAPREPDAKWVSFDPAAMIDGLRTMLRTRTINPDKPRAKLRVVFDAAAVAAALEGANCHWLVASAWMCADYDVQVELVHHEIGGVPTIVNDRISLLVNTLMEMRHGDAREVVKLDIEQLRYASAVLKAGRMKWPTHVAAHAGAALIEQQRLLQQTGNAGAVVTFREER